MKETARESGENFAPLSKNALKTIFTRFRAARITSQSIITEKEAIRGVGRGQSEVYTVARYLAFAQETAKTRLIRVPSLARTTSNTTVARVLPIARNGKNEVYPVSKFVTRRSRGPLMPPRGPFCVVAAGVKHRTNEDFSARDVLVKASAILLARFSLGRDAFRDEKATRFPRL